MATKIGGLCVLIFACAMRCVSLRREARVAHFLKSPVLFVSSQSAASKRLSESEQRGASECLENIVKIFSVDCFPQKLTHS